MKNLVKKLLEKLLEKPLARLAKWVAKQNREADAAREAERRNESDAGGMGVPASPSSEAGVSDPLAGSSSENPPPSSKPWRECRLSSNWADGASKRMMNLLSPKFSEAKVAEYLDWQVSLGCDHVHLIFVNQGDGEGAGYDALADASAKAVALKRVKEIRARGLGIVGWIVADDSDEYRKRVFADPAKYASALKDFMPYLSYIVLGLEMDEGEGSSGKWSNLREAIRKAGWSGEFATHHTGGQTSYASLGKIVMDQLDKNCTAAQVKESVKALRKRGYEVCGFEYARGPDRAKAQAALDGGAFSVGNWGK